MQLYHRLSAQGYHPWLDKEDLLPGQNWRSEIPKAIRNSRVFIACLSQNSVAKHGYVQREYRMALNTYADKPPGSIYLIPLRLDDCEIPDLRQEEYGINLRDLQWVNLFETNGFERLVKALRQAFPDSSSSLVSSTSRAAREHDVFISYASEDKDVLVRPLAKALQNEGLDVWYDEFALRIGDSLRQKIDQGLSRSRVGLVVLSPSFMAKGWTSYELDGLAINSVSKEQVLLPIWHNITKQQVMAYSPSLADKVARSSATSTVQEIAAEIADLLN